MKEIKNAIIERAELTTADHGCLIGWIHLDYGNSVHQGFGGYVLYAPINWKHHKLDSVAGHWIYRVMEIAGVTSWDNLVGKSIRVKADHCGIDEIGHITKNDWFNPSKDFEELND